MPLRAGAQASMPHHHGLSIQVGAIGHHSLGLHQAIEASLPSNVHQTAMPLPFRSTAPPSLGSTLWGLVLSKHWAITPGCIASLATLRHRQHRVYPLLASCVQSCSSIWITGLCILPNISNTAPSFITPWAKTSTTAGWLCHSLPRTSWRVISHSLYSHSYHISWEPSPLWLKTPQWGLP